MLLPQVLSELVIAAVSLAFALALWTSLDMAEVLDTIDSMDSSDVTSMIRLPPEHFRAIAIGAGVMADCDSGLLRRARLISARS
jgi:hypothetical protein